MKAGGRALGALLVLTLLWGYSWVLAKQALHYAGPFTLSALRSAAGVAALFAFLALAGRPLRPVAVRRTFAVGLFQTGGFMAFQTWALVEGGAGGTSILVFTMPIWTLLLAWLALGERVRGVQWLAAGATLGGLSLIIAPWDFSGRVLPKVLALLAALSWAVSTVLIKRWRASLAADVLVLTAWQMAFGSALLIVVASFVHERPVDWAPQFVAILLALALAITALGWYLWLYVLEHLPAWQASLSVLGIPVVALLLSHWLLGERMSGAELAGMLLIGAGLALLNLMGWRAQRRLGERTG